MRPVLVIDEGPFHAGGKACAAAAAQAGVLDHVGHICRLHFHNGLLERSQPAVIFVGLEFVKVGDIAVAKYNVSHYFTSLAYLRPAITSRVLSIVIFSWYLMPSGPCVWNIGAR